MKDWGVLLPVLCHVFASALEMKCSLNANSCCWLSGSNKAWPPIVIYVKMGYITCSDFDGFVSQTEPSTMCKIAHFARKVEGWGQNFHNVNKFLAFRNYIQLLWGILLPLLFGIQQTVEVRKCRIFVLKWVIWKKVSFLELSQDATCIGHVLLSFTTPG